MRDAHKSATVSTEPSAILSLATANAQSRVGQAHSAIHLALPEDLVWIARRSAIVTSVESATRLAASAYAHPVGTVATVNIRVIQDVLE